MIVLGIDPGLANTGYGGVERRGGRLVALDGGVVETRAPASNEQRLGELHAALTALLREHTPHAMALETLYFGQNVRTAFAVGQARGVGQRARSEGPGWADGRRAARAAIRAAPRPRGRRAGGGDLPRQPCAVVN